MTAKKRLSRQQRRERLFAGRVPGQAITKEQHDDLVARKGRPLTQDPIGTTPRTLPTTKDQT